MKHLHKGRLVPACGGLERPFTVRGVRWLYCWHTAAKRHVYLNLDTDIAEWHRDFHPAFAPQYAGLDDGEAEPKVTLDS